MLIKGSAEAAAGEMSIVEKSSFHDLVTKYDRESERLIVDYIFQQHPDSTIMGEEGGAMGNGSVHWYVDPIDGTSNFASGIPFFSVSIGATFNGQLIAGVIYDPIRHELFSATTSGAFLNGRPIQAHGHRTDAASMLLTAYPSPHSGVEERDYKLFAELVKSFATVRRMGSAALSLAYVASGRVDVAFEPGINPWDVAAGLFIVQQAGGQYVPFGSADTPQSQPWKFPKFIASCPEFDLEQSQLALILAKGR